MTADEMFEKLGYSIKESWHSIVFKKNIVETLDYGVIKTEKTIGFIKNTKEIYSYSTLTLDELKAINQKYKELGWNDNEN